MTPRAHPLAYGLGFLDPQDADAGVRARVACQGPKARGGSAAASRNSKEANSFPRRAAEGRPRQAEAAVPALGRGHACGAEN